MASKERQEEIAAEKKKAAHDAVVGKPVQQTTDMFLCGRCKQRKCTYFQMQTRSADEPMVSPGSFQCFTKSYSFRRLQRLLSLHVLTVGTNGR